MASDASINVVASLVAEVSDFVQKFTTDVPAAVQEGMGKVQDAVNDATSKVTDGLNESAESAGKAGEEVGNSFGEGLMLVMAAVSAEFLDKLREAFGEAAEMGEDLKNEMAQLGGSAESVQKLNYAFATFGVSAGEATQSIVMFQRKLQDAVAKGSGKDIFSRSGLDPKAMVGQSASTNIEQVANAMRGMSNESERSELALAAFNRAGQKLIPILMEGGPAFQALEDSADKAGGVLGGEDVEKLDKLQEKLNQLGVTVKVFAASFIAPFADMAQSIAQHIQDIYAAFEKLSQNDKLALVFGAIATATAMAEKGLELIKPLLSGLIGPEVTGSLLAFVGGLLGIIPVLALLGVAWSQNFGNLKVVVNEIVAAVAGFWQHCKDAFEIISADAKQVLGPAFSDLSKAVGKLAQDFANWLTDLSQSRGFFTDLEAVAHALAVTLSAVIEVIVWFAGVIKDLEPALLSIMSTIGDLATEIKDNLGGVLTGVGIIAVGVFLPQLIAAFGGIVGAIDTAVVAFTVLRDMFVSGEIIASIGGIVAALNPIGIAIIAIGVLVVALAANWDTVSDAVSSLWHMAVTAFAAIVQWLGTTAQAVADLFTAIANVIGQIPGLNGVADAANGIGTAFQWAADRATDLYNAIVRANSAKANKTTDIGQGTKGLGFGDGDTTAADDARKASYGVAAPGTFDTWSDKAPEVGGGGSGAGLGSSGGRAPHAAHAHAGKAGTSASELDTAALDALKDKLEPYQDALKQTQLLLSELTVAQEKLGKIDTWAKVVAQSAIYNKQIAATIALEKQENDLAAADLRNRTAALAMAAKDKDPKEKRRDTEAAKTYGNDASAAKLRALEDENKALKLEQSKASAPIEYEKGVAGDSELPDAVRLAAINDEIWRTLNKEVTTKDEIANRTEKLVALEKQKLAIVNASATLQANLLKSQDAITKANVDSQKAIRDATPLGADPTGAKAQARSVADASDDVTNAKAAADAANASVEALKVQIDALTAAVKPGVPLTKDEIKLQTDLNLALAQAKTANTAATVAQLQLTQAQQATTPAVTQVRSALLGMAQQVAGPLMDVLKSIQMGVNPILAIFEALFQKSKAFNDILVIMGKIMDSVAQVFDALRPVIDLLLGVIVGVVNVFLTMYNVIVRLLDMFGLGIQAIQLVTDTLTGLNAAVPLLQITHDLPTMNEVNANKMSSLVAQQSNTDNGMDVGFNQGLANIGQILGTLLGMYALMKIFGSVIGGQGVGGGITGVINQVKGLFGGLFGGKKTNSDYSGPASNSGSYGGWGDNDTTANDPAAIGAAIANGIKSTSDSAISQMIAIPPSSSVIATEVETVPGTSVMGTEIATLVSSSNLGALVSAVNPSSVLGSLLGQGTSTSSNGSAGGLTGMFSSLLGSSTSDYSGPDSSNESFGSWGDSSGSSSTNNQSDVDYMASEWGGADDSTVASGMNKSNASSSLTKIMGSTASLVSLFGMLGGGGTGSGSSAASSIGSAFGPVLSSLLHANPLISAGIDIVLPLITSLFGHKDNPADMPDKYDTANWTKDIGELTGNAGTAYGPAYNPSTDPVAQSLGGQSELGYIQSWISANLTSKVASTKAEAESLLAEYGTTGGGQINLDTDLANGQVRGGSLSGTYTSIQAAAQATITAIQSIGSTMQGLLGSASAIDLAKMFGNGTSVTAGGYNVMSGGNSTMGNTGPSSFNVNIDTVNGTDASALQSAFQPIFAEYGRQQQIASRTQNSSAGRYNF